MNLKTLYQAVVSTAILIGLPSVAVANTAETDPYVAGFAAYAKEVAEVERKVGYIGQELPIPKAVKVMEGVYTVVGSYIWGTPANFGLNNNLTAIVFKDGVFVYNAGPNAGVAYSFHQQIKRLTDKPVKWLAVENDQSHAYFGSSYWYDVGVKNLYSEKRANDNWHRIFEDRKTNSSLSIGKAISMTIRDVTDKFTTFEGRKTIDVGGGETIELIDFGGGHTPTMTGMYVPSRNLLFTGDLGFNERMPGLLHDSNSKEWLESFERMVSMVPEDVTVIPGHGTPSDLATLKRQTYDYFVELTKSVEAVIAAGGGIEEVEKIDQSEHKDRPVFDQLAESNARHIYEEIMAEKHKESPDPSQR